MPEDVEVPIKPRVRQAQVDDFEQVYPLLLKMNNAQLKKQDWHRLFENHWSLDEFSPGIVLQAGDNIVGFIGTVYSRQAVAGQSQLFCNLTTWIVLDEYRSYSILMLFTLLKNKNMVLTSFSSNQITYEVYKRLGFKDGNKCKRIVYPLPFPAFRSADYEVIIDAEQIDSQCNPDNKTLFNDHRLFCRAAVLVTHNNAQCLLMGTCRNGSLVLYSASDREFFQQHLKHFRNKLMAAFQVKRLQIDEQLLNGRSLFLSRRVTWSFPYQYKAGSEIESSLPSPSPEYSEVFLLDM